MGTCRKQVLVVIMCSFRLEIELDKVKRIKLPSNYSVGSMQLLYKPDIRNTDPVHKYVHIVPGRKVSVSMDQRSGVRPNKY